MKFLGKLKPYLLPIGLGIIGALVYDRWVKNRLPAMLRGGSMLLMLTLALACSAPDLRAEVVTKGGAINLRPLNRETANSSYTSGVPNPGLPLLLRISTWQLTNHFGFDTNARPVVVNLGTNFTGYTGPINPATATGPGMLYFKHGLLVTSNQAASNP